MATTIYMTETTTTEQKTSVIPDLRPGMTVRIHQKIREVNPKGEEKERVQVFEGMIIARHKRKGTDATVTVRKISNGGGVEKIFPVNLPTIIKWGDLLEKFFLPLRRLRFFAQ